MVAETETLPLETHERAGPTVGFLERDDSADNLARLGLVSRRRKSVDETGLDLRVEIGGHVLTCVAVDHARADNAVKKFLVFDGRVERLERIVIQAIDDCVELRAQVFRFGLRGGNRALQGQHERRRGNCQNSLHCIHLPLPGGIATPGLRQASVTRANLRLPTW